MITIKRSLHLLFILLLPAIACAGGTSHGLSLTFIDIDNIQRLKQQLEMADHPFGDVKISVMKGANAALKHKPDPVTNKPAAGLSGDMHDYVSLAPYFWPNPDTKNGLPWLRKDGQVNPLTRGDNTDQARASGFLKALGKLNLGYLYSDDTQYLDKAKQLINVWLVDPKTKMNPNLDYAQGIPGVNNGRPFGIIEFEKVAYIVTAMELLKHNRLADKKYRKAVDQWLGDYLNWLQTSELGVQESTRKNNHATWYDHQVLGLMLYLGKERKAKVYAEEIKARRIDTQIAADGKQPHELARTKSINYSSMNLFGFVENAYLARKVGVDLWGYTGAKGQSIPNGIDFLRPFVRGEKTWQHKQIKSSFETAFQNKTMPMFYAAYSYFGEQAINSDELRAYLPHIKASVLASYGLPPMSAL